MHLFKLSTHGPKPPRLRSGNPSAKLPVALLGGPKSGKTQLFQAMLFRCHSRRWAGALSPFLDRGSVNAWRLGAEEDTKLEVTNEILNAYLNWRTYQGTGNQGNEQYLLDLAYRTGWLGRSRRRLQLELWNGRAEGPSWEQTVLEAQVLLLALPLWAAFPDLQRLTDQDLRRRRDHLEAFQVMVARAQAVRQSAASKTRASTMVLLTMADDLRCGLTDLRESWIHGVVDRHQHHLQKLRQPRHLLTYLHNARRVSNYLGETFASSRETSRVLDVLEEPPGAKPWFLPLSAIDGRLLDRDEARLQPQSDEPVPVHVELPLLLALCRHADALR